MRLLMLAQNLWTLAFVLALMKMRLDFFHVGRDRNEPLGTQGQPSNLTMPQPHTHGSLGILSLVLCERTQFLPAVFVVNY